MNHANEELAQGTGVLNKLWQNKKLFAIVFSAVMGLTILALAVLPVRYRATSSVIVAEPEPSKTNESVAWAQKIGDPADLESQLLVIRSPRVVRLAMSGRGVQQAILDECRFNNLESGLGRIFADSVDLCSKLKDDGAAFVEYVQTRYLVGAVGRSRVIDISYQSPLPEVAQTMANALASAFLDDQRTGGSNSREEAVSRMRQELQQLDAELRDADAKIQAFRRTNGLTRGATAPISSEQLTSISQQLSVAEGARDYAAARLRQIKAGGSGGDFPDVLASRSIADLKQQLNVTSAQLASASDLLGPKHPSLQALQREQALLKDRLAQEIASIAASAQKTFEANDALVTSLKKQMDAVKNEVGSATSAETSIENMVRDAEIKRRRYAELSSKADELETDRQVLLGNTRLVSLAELPIKPFFPKKLPFLAAGSTVAVLIAVVASVVSGPWGSGGGFFPLFSGGLSSRRMARSRNVPAGSPLAPSFSIPPAAVRSAESWKNLPLRNVPSDARDSELSIVTGLPILTRLPLLPNSSASSIGAILNEHTDKPLWRALQQAQTAPGLQERLRELNAELAVAENAKRGRRILVTSPGDAEGKSFLTLTLAGHLASTGRRVLIVEYDLSNPAFETALSLRRSGGLQAVLRGESHPRDAVVSTANPNLDALAAGFPAGVPNNRSAQKQLSNLLLWAHDYDDVIIDGPPAAGLKDCQNLAASVDKILLCLRCGRSSVGQTIAAKTAIEAAGGRIDGLAITMDNSETVVRSHSSPTWAAA
jgi:uncharacterized protein involved in exopolysaccharide biosynthesis/Mrp family chromosome partitioning ATPase